MTDVVNYYKTYHRAYNNQGYRMEKHKEASRIYFLQDYVKQFTPKGGKVLDVGCGDLYLSTVLPEYEWQGVDIGPPEGAPKDKILIHDISNAPYALKAASYDTVICSEVLEHVWDPYVIVKEIRRLIKPGGTFIMSTPNFDHIDLLLTRHRPVLYDPQQSHLVEHIRNYNLQTHAKMLEANDFQIAAYHGADAHFSEFFFDARQILKKYLNEQVNAGVDDGNVDQVLGLMFPDYSHTIMIIAKPVKYVGNNTVLAGG